jgi:hypothetical protein
MTHNWLGRSLQASGFVFLLLFLLVVYGCGGDDSNFQNGTIKVTMLIEMDEKDARWFRDIEVPKGMNGYELTEKVTDGHLQSTYYPSLRAHFVQGLLGKGNGDNKYWAIYIWSESENKWEPIPVGVDLYSLKDGHVLGWYQVPADRSDRAPSATP